MKKSLALGLLIMFFPLFIMAATTYTVKSGDTLYSIAKANKLSLSSLIRYNPSIKNPNMIYPGQSLNLSAPATTTPTPAPTTSTPTPTIPKTTTPVPSTTPASGESRFSAYITGYTYWDNTPPGSATISDPVIHSKAGGTGTYSDPITVAVGHTISGGTDTLDYPAGTKFYIPTLRKYFVVEDTCGDGSTPQNGPCHTGYQGKPWLDVWVDGAKGSSSSSNSCAEKITEIHLVIKNPASTYAVAAGPIMSSTCASLFGDTVVLN